MKVTVGGRERIAEVSLLIPKGEDAWLEFPAEGWICRINLRLEVTEHGQEKRNMRMEAGTDHGTLILTNWIGSGHLAFTEPMAIVYHNNRDIVVFASGESLGDITLVNLSFFWQERKNV